MRVLTELKENVTGDGEGEFIATYKTDSGSEMDVFKYESFEEREKVHAELKAVRERKLDDEELDELVHWLRIQADLNENSMASRNPYVKGQTNKLRKWADRITQIDGIIKERK